MKIYQIHKTGGCWEDYYDYIVASYLSKEKALAEKECLEEKENIFKKCMSCPLYFCEDDCDNNCEECSKYSVERAMKYCDRYKAGINNDCVNHRFNYEDSSYNIEEVEVIE